MLKQRVFTAVILLASALGMLLWLPTLWLSIPVGVVVLLAAREWGQMMGCQGARRWRFVLLIVALSTLVWADHLRWIDVTPSGHRLQGVFLVSALFWLTLTPIHLLLLRFPLRRVIGFFYGALLIIPGALALLWIHALSVPMLLSVLGIAWVSDTAAYFAGRTWGRHKLAPNISPGKSWEGVIAGALAVCAYAAFLAHEVTVISQLCAQVGWTLYLLGALLLALIGVVGDLLESLVKRIAGVKDSGTLLPGHGGVLDRIDSLTAILPIAALMLSWVSPAWVTH
jgi:phosphatidate cytidylyltransferase